VKESHKSHTTQRHEGTKEKSKTSAVKDRVPKSSSNRCESTDLRQGAGLPGFIPGPITLLSLLVSLCLCVEPADFFTPSYAVGYMTYVTSPASRAFKRLRSHQKLMGVVNLAPAVLAGPAAFEHQAPEN